LRICQNQFFSRQPFGRMCRTVFACSCIALLCLPKSTPAQSPQSTELTRISSLIQQGKLEQAEQRLHVYLIKLPHSPKANSLLGVVYLRQERYKQAEEPLQEAITRAPGLLEPRVDLGDAYLAEGKPDLALAAYRAASKLAAHDVRTNVALAKLYLTAGEFAKSIEAAGNIPTQKRTAELLPTLAADYFGLGQPEKASVEIQGMLQISEKESDLVPELAEFFLAHKDFKSAQQLLVLAQPKQPVTDRLLVDSALTDAGLGQLDEAQKKLESILARTPESLGALIAAGKVASLQSDWAAAVEAFSRAAKIGPRRPDILYSLASAQLYANQLEPARHNAEELHTLEPDDLRSTYLLALAVFGLKDWDAAKSYAQQVLAAHPDDREMNLILADIAFNNEHNFQAARKRVDICLRQNPKDPGALYYLGMIQKLGGDVSGAMQSLSLSVSGNPSNGDAQGALGSLCLQAGDLTCAVSALTQAVLLAPKEAQNHYQLALAYSRSNVPDKATEQLQIYQQMKAQEAKEAAGAPKGPSSIQVSPLGVVAHP
jgi:tetratricopeptide (TPR) repeat protein